MKTEIRSHNRKCDACVRKKDSLKQKVPLLPVGIKKTFEKEWRPLISTDAAESAHVFFEELICRHGSCDLLITDIGTNFRSSLFTEVHETSYHHEANGKVERAISTLMKILTTYLTSGQLDRIYA